MTPFKQTTMVGERDPKFYSELKQINEDLLSFLKETHAKSPYFDFSPTVNDYVKQIGDLEKHYPEKSAPISTTTTTANITSSIPKPSPFTFSAAAAPFMPSNVNNTLGASQPVPTSIPALTSQPFLFGSQSLATSAAPASLASTNTTTSTSFFSFTLPKKDEPAKVENSNNDDKGESGTDADDDAPPEPKIDKFEEQGAKYSVKCKLYEKGKTVHGEVNVDMLGIGTLYVKAMDAPKKLQVIIRQDPDLRRVLLNEVITPNLPVKLLPKAVQLVFPRPGEENKFYIVKTRDEQEARALHDILDMTKN